MGIDWWVRLPAFAVALVVGLRVGRVRCPPREVRPPVRGRWMALGGPAERVPSQGTHAYGQGYALLLVAEPGAGTRPDIGWRPLSRPPGDFPGFGAPVYAPAAGVVVGVCGRWRDHRSRTSWPWLLGMAVESALRELWGASGLFGNHVVIDLGDGCYALLAHLRKGSVRVRPGQRVEEGEEIAACGNSGACVEPQVHFQLMDGPRPWRAAGLPFRWAPDSVQGVPEDGVPRAWRPFRA